jgi:hypothetical protein
MEVLLTYLLKSSGLMAAFFLAYHFLLRKETFFSSNRWFLLAGLVTSALLPLFFIKKIVFVERPKLTIDDLVALPNNSSEAILNVPVEVQSIDWVQTMVIGYGIVVVFLFLKLVFNLFSVFKLVRNKAVLKNDGFSIIDINQDITPFSFFNYIVFNSTLYSDQELESILLHEKVHSKQKHSFDVIVAQLFAIVFWINPLVWLYKKAIIQNLEFIADSKAIQNIEDKKCYQMALLKVVSHQNCLPITNPFYQSLIKKRIVMLNKNQSNKRNLWKYSLVIPVLIAFVFLFQIQVVAQEKQSNRSIVDLTWTKNSTDQEFKEDAENATKTVKFDFSKIERNDKNEITSITISFKDNLGNEDTSTFENKNGINTIHFVRDIDENGKGQIGYFGRQDIIHADINIVDGITINQENEKYESIYNSQFESDTEDNLDRLFIINGKPYTKEDLKGKNIAIIDGNIIKLSPKEAITKYGKRAKDGAVIFKGETEIIDNVLDADFPAPSPPPAPPFTRKTTSEINQEKNRLNIINGKEYFQNDLKDYTLKSDIEQAKLDIEQAQKDLEQSKIDLEQSKRDIEQSKIDKENNKREHELSKDELKEQRKIALEKRKIALEKRKAAIEERKKEIEQAKKK